MFKKVKGHCSKGGNLCPGGEEDDAILHFLLKVAPGGKRSKC